MSIALPLSCESTIEMQYADIVTFSGHVLIPENYIGKEKEIKIYFTEFRAGQVLKNFLGEGLSNSNT